MADLGASPFTISTTANYTIPPWVTSLQVECYGGGATGRDGYPSGYGGGGGGGGAYSKRNAMPVTPGNSYTFTVGATAVFDDPGVNGNQSTVTGDLGVVCTAVGGATPASDITRGIGGAAGSCVGDVKYSGGNGGWGGNGAGGGGGGEGAWSGGDGNVGSNSSGPWNGGAGGTGTAGGDGGRGGNTGTNAGVAPGVTPGGGGGGSGIGDFNSPAGNGAAGRIIVTYTANTNSFVLEGN